MNKTMGKLRVGVIGVGYLGKYHAEKYSALADVVLQGVADVDAVAGRAVADKLGTAYYHDYKEILKNVDAVSIVVPTTLHYEIAKECLQLGVDVLIEKPMTSTLEQADALINLAAEKKCIVQVGHLERFNPAVMAMEEHLTYPLFIESHRIHMFKPRGLDVDVVLDLMIHDIDIILSIVKSPIKTIHTVGVPVVTATTDIANARIIFENGCTANVTVSRISRDNIRRIRVFQPRCFVSVDYGSKEITVIKLGTERGENGLPHEEITRNTFADADSLALEIQDFVSNVRSRQRPRVSGEDGRRALEVALQIMGQIKVHADNFKHLLQP